MPRKRTTFSPKQSATRVYATYQVSAELKRITGEPQKGFSMLIWGSAGSGKTTLMMKMIKEFSQIGKCYFNSLEMGEGKSVQNLVDRFELSAIEGDRITIADRHSIEQMVEALKTNRAVFVFIDSIDYMSLSKAEFIDLQALFPNKTFIMIAWGEGKHPVAKASKAIEFMVDVKCHVKDGVAFTRSRFGATDPYVIMSHLAKRSSNKEVKQALKNVDLVEDEAY